MSGTVYLNGEYLPADQARVSVFDRGFLFGDGVYEVIPVVAGQLVDVERALERLARSLEALEIPWPCSSEQYVTVLEQLISRNQLDEGAIYAQITRGVAPRDFAYPAGLVSSFMAYATARPLLDNPQAETGVAVVTVPDIRWQRRDIKSLNLLGQCMAKEQAARQGAFEAWMVEEGLVTEGASSSAFIVRDGSIVTRALSNSILPGIRRQVILDLAGRHGLGIEQRAFSLQEAREADEAFLSSATTLLLPVVQIDGKAVGTGRPGPIARDLRKHYIQALMEQLAVK